jgi:hypothetical protein
MLIDVKGESYDKHILETGHDIHISKYVFMQYA